MKIFEFICQLLNRKVFQILLICALFFHTVQAQNQETSNLIEIKHKILLLHPGINSDEKQNGILTEIQDNLKKASQYFMDVESVICLDHQCKIEKVRIFWDKYGIYSKFELPRGVILEKAEGKPFTDADYKKLQNVLSDLNSPIKYYYQDKIIDVGYGAGSEGVDAVSGATSLVDITAIVEGAAWTTCTLWHWANGEIITIMRKITASQFTNQELKSGFESSDKNYKIFAIEELTRRNVYEKTSVIIELNHKNEDIDLTKVIITYIENAASEVYYDSFKKLFVAANNEERILLLNSLNNTNKVGSNEFYEWLSNQLLSCKSYQELQLSLRIVENKKAVSATTINSTIQLLNDAEFITTRSAYWFLQNKKLSTEQQDKVELFRKKYSDRL